MARLRFRFCWRGTRGWRKHPCGRTCWRTRGHGRRGRRRAARGSTRTRCLGRGAVGPRRDERRHALPEATRLGCGPARRTCDPARCRRSAAVAVRRLAGLPLRWHHGRLRESWLAGRDQLAHRVRPFLRAVASWRGKSGSYPVLPGATGHRVARLPGPGRCAECAQGVGDRRRGLRRLSGDALTARPRATPR